MRRKVLPHLREKRKERSHQRREKRAVNIPTEQAVEEYPIAKGGRCGRSLLKEAITALRAGDVDSMREILQNFEELPQPECAAIHTRPLSTTLTRPLETAKPPPLYSQPRAGELFSVVFEAKRPRMNSSPIFPLNYPNFPKL